MIWYDLSLSILINSLTVGVSLAVFPVQKKMVDAYNLFPSNIWQRAAICKWVVKENGYFILWTHTVARCKNRSHFLNMDFDQLHVFLSEKMDLATVSS